MNEFNGNKYWVHTLKCKVELKNRCLVDHVPGGGFDHMYVLYPKNVVWVNLKARQFSDWMSMLLSPHRD